MTRPALRAALDAGADRTLTLVCAPPGFGKTLLLADWVRRSPEIPTAWVSLDPDDHDPRRLWSAVLAALAACPAVPASSGLRRLVVSRTTVESDLVVELLDGLENLPSPMRLVLDDVHHVRSGPALKGLQALVRGHASGARLVLASRLDPGLGLPRLRLEDRLCELRADRLRFSARESALLMARAGLRLTQRQGELLHRRTAGWVAGLRLAAMSLRGHPDPDRFLAAFSGDDRAVADYLVGEVLAGISEDQRDVLLRTSVVDPVPAALAVELCDREDAADLLDALEHDLGLVTATGPHRCDYHIEELLRSYLLADLDRQGVGLAAGLHRRAAGWWDRQGRSAEALRHAAQAGDVAGIDALLHRRAVVLATRGEHDSVLAALAAVGAGSGADPWYAALRAQVHLGLGDRAAVSAQIARARGGGRVPLGSDVATFLTATERLAGIGDRPEGEEQVPDDPALAALARAGRGAALLSTGAWAAGRAELEAALDHARALGLALLEVQCRCLQGAAAWATGDYRAASSTASAAVAGARAGGWAGSAWGAGAQAVAALAALERARPDEALQAAADGLRGAPADLDPVIRFALCAAHGGALLDTGEEAAGLLELQHARAEVGEAPIPAPLAATAALLEQRVALRLGHLAAASAAASWLAGWDGVRAECLLGRAWTEAAGGATAAARSTIAPLLVATGRPAVPGTVVEAWLVEAASALTDGDRPSARHAVRVALDRAEPLDALRPFTLAPPEVRALLVDLLGGVGDRRSFAARALSAQRCYRRPPPAVLTARECDVLSRLPSLLNLDEIADDLSLSVNTIKSHVRAIYDKLGAGTRRGAVLLAHERGLLRE